MKYINFHCSRYLKIIVFKIYPQTFKCFKTVGHLEIFPSQYLSSSSFCNLSNLKIRSNRTSYWKYFYHAQLSLWLSRLYWRCGCEKIYCKYWSYKFKNSQRELSRYSDMPGHSVLTGKYWMLILILRPKNLTRCLLIQSY